VGQVGRGSGGRVERARGGVENITGAAPTAGNGYSK